MEVQLEIEAAVATVTLAAPERRNALTPAMARELGDALRTVDEDQRVGALVIRGAGGYFCAGGDRDTLSKAGADPADDTHFKDMDALYQSFLQLSELEVPTICALRGGAVGAGVNLALAADVRVIARDALLLAGFMRIGAHPGGGHFALVERAVGMQAAVAMTLLEEPVDGELAVRLGLAFEAHEDEEVEPRARELAERVRDPELVRFSTATLRAHSRAHGVPQAVALRAEQAGQMWSLRRAARH